MLPSAVIELIRDLHAECADLARDRDALLDRAEASDRRLLQLAVQVAELRARLPN